MKKLIITFGIFVLLVIAGNIVYPQIQSHALTPDAAEKLDNTDTAPTEPVETGPKITTQTYTIQDGDTFTVAMEALGIPYSDALTIVENATDIFDFTNVKLGKTFTLVSEDGLPIRLEYEPNSEDIITVNLTDLTTTEAPIPYDIEVAQASVTITDSLYLSGINAGLPETLILKIAEVFAWEIDFATQTQANDSFNVLYEKRLRNGQEAGVGDVLAVTFTNVGETSEAYRFTDIDGKITYFDEDGNSLVRPFLKAPVEYGRISSGYTNNRFHPTLEKNMPHLAIDYAAPLGTPILAVGDGVVTMAQWYGGFGNYIDIRHNDTFETQYAHLSAFNVSVGDRVKQGDVIGFVGSTGFSTGPHVHYQVRVNGELLNPLEIEFPAGDPIEEERLQDFYTARDAYRAQM